MTEAQIQKAATLAGTGFTVFSLAMLTMRLLGD